MRDELFGLWNGGKTLQREVEAQPVSQMQRLATESQRRRRTSKGARNV